MNAPALRAALLALLAARAVTAGDVVRLPPTGERADRRLVALADADGWSPDTPRFEVGALFDKGVFIRGTDLQRDPYALYVGARVQLRHTGFTRDAESWTDNAGVTREIRNRNHMETERLRVNLSGTAIDPALTYYFVLDGDADGASNVDLLASIVTYEFDEALQLRLGRWKVASHREWLLSSRYLTLVDRSMATEFFRVGFSDGAWLLGDLDHGMHYEMSLTNGARTGPRRATDLDDNLGAAATLYWDALGPYGPGMVDYARHADPVVRVGAGLTFEKSTERPDVEIPLGDNNFLRLSNGTRLADTGSLGAGVSVLGARTLEGAVDVAVKWRGWFASGEWFIRSIQDITADGPIVVSQVNDHGYRFDTGVFLVPQRFDVLARLSHVSGPFGDAWEYAAGFNYYWGSGRRDGKLDDRINKFSFDVTALGGSPVSSGPSDLVAGDDGVLFRTQVQVGF